MLHLPQRRRLAFTVPEVLAVVAVIAIILSIILPALGRSKEAAHAARCASNLHQLHIAYHSQKTEAKARITTTLNAYTWQGQLRPYLSDGSALFCPMQGVGSGNAASNSGTAGTAVSAPGNPGAPPDAASQLYLKVFSGNTYLYDMAMEEGPLCRRVDKQMTDAQIDALWVGHPNALAARGPIKNYRNNLPGNVYSYLLCFEDIRPNGGDRDYEDVVFQIDEVDDGIRISYLYDGAGYWFEMWKRDGTLVWPHMDTNGQTKPGTAGTYTGAPGQAGAPDAHTPGTGASSIIPGGLTSYGMSLAANLLTRGGGKNVILLLDYTRHTAQCTSTTGLDPWTDWLKPNGIPNFARHYEKANVLYTDGGVRLLDPASIDPKISQYRTDHWVP